MHFKSYVIGVDLSKEEGGGSWSSQVLSLHSGENGSGGPALMCLTFPSNGRVTLDFPPRACGEKSQLTRELVAMLHEKAGKWLEENPE